MHVTLQTCSRATGAELSEPTDMLQGLQRTTRRSRHRVPVEHAKSKLHFSEINHFVMAITAAKAATWHVARRKHGRTQMRKTTLFAVATAAMVVTLWGTSHTHTSVATAALIATTGWGTSPANAPVPSTGVETFQLMMNAKDLPTVEFVDYTFVF
jgi:hypothetical protein